MQFRVQVAYKRGSEPKNFIAVVNTDSHESAEAMVTQHLLSRQPTIRLRTVSSYHK